jgi:hypothetical protein
MRHRLNTYIIKNPPEDKISKAEKRCASHQQQISLYATMTLRRFPIRHWHWHTAQPWARHTQQASLAAHPLCRLKKQEEERMQEAAGDNLDKEAKVKKDSKKKCVLTLAAATLSVVPTSLYTWAAVPGCAPRLQVSRAPGLTSVRLVALCRDSCSTACV